MNLIRGSLLPALAVGLVCMVVAGLIDGGEGVAGAAVGAGIVSLFFISTPLALGSPAKGRPRRSVLYLAGFLLGNALALAASMMVLFDVGGIGSHLGAGALAGSVIANTLAWTAAMVRAFTKLRQPLYDLDSDR